MNKKIIVELVPHRNPENTFYPYYPKVVYSTHPKYKVGTGFDYGFMYIALEEGYDVTLLGSSYVDSLEPTKIGDDE